MTLALFFCLGVREADINVAEGKKRARILTSEAFKTEQVNQALGEAEAVVAMANARAAAIETVAMALMKEVNKSMLGLGIFIIQFFYMKYR